MTRSNLFPSLVIALCFGSFAQAQTVYRIVQPDGKVIFSDKPPVTAEKGKVGTVAAGAAGAAAAGSGTASLPFELRQVVNRYPVTLYTTADCAPCASGRSFLNTRGIPFSERTVTTKDDVDALKRISSDASLPFLTIGAQPIKGFSDAEWSQYLDAAGYPRTSRLPTAYRNPPASPLVVVQAPVAAKPAEETPVQSAEPVSPSAPSASNPAGIQF